MMEADFNLDFTFSKMELSQNLKGLKSSFGNFKDLQDLLI